MRRPRRKYQIQNTTFFSPNLSSWKQLYPYLVTPNSPAQWVGAAACKELEKAPHVALTLILPSVQVNIRAGEMAPAEDNGVSYLKVPINQL